MYTTSTYDVAFRFEKIVANIFENHNITTMLTPKSRDSQYDMLATLNDINYVIEVKFSRTKHIPSTILFIAACRLKEIADIERDSLRSKVPILVVVTLLLADIRKRMEDIGVIVIDIQNFLFLVQNNEALKSELLSILDFSVNDILPKEPGIQIFNCQKDLLDTPQAQGESLRERIAIWNTSDGNAQYEDLCYETLKYLFDNKLSLWHRQETSNAELYR